MSSSRRKRSSSASTNDDYSRRESEQHNELRQVDSYTGLDNARRQIRLLKILDFTDVLECSLTVASRDDGTKV